MSVQGVENDKKLRKFVDFLNAQKILFQVDDVILYKLMPVDHMR